MLEKNHNIDNNIDARNAQHLGVHHVLGTTMSPPFPDHYEVIYLGGGCFWGLEEILWHRDGVYTTFVGYGGGHYPWPTYAQVCTGKTGHVELVGVVFDSQRISLPEILAIFWQSHDPTLMNRQGADIGTQYRSAVFTTTQAQYRLTCHIARQYENILLAAGYDKITTEIAMIDTFYYAESYHQQYLAKNPAGYRCHSQSPVYFPIYDDVPVLES